MQSFLTQPKLRALCAVATAMLALLIAWQSLVPPSDIPGPKLWDKLMHFIAYGCLGVPAALWLGPRKLVICLILVIAYGAGLELAQHLSPTAREGSVQDGLANAIGALAGISLVGLARDFR